MEDTEDTHRGQAKKKADADAQSPKPDPQVVLILVGLIGCGKSTFAQALQTYFPRFRRCNQDELGDRRAVETLVRSSLREGLSVCIDRTNVDVQQRSTWVQIARETPHTLVWALEFDIPHEVCMQRVIGRTSHPTITSPELGISVLQRFKSQYQPPQPWEGFDKILSLSMNDQPPHGYTEPELSAILTRLHEAPRIAPSEWISESTRGRGRGSHGYQGFQRGRWRAQYAPRGSSRGRAYHPTSESPPLSQQAFWRGEEARNVHRD